LLALLTHLPLLALALLALLTLLALLSLLALLPLLALLALLALLTALALLALLSLLAALSTLVLCLLLLILLGAEGAVELLTLTAHQVRETLDGLVRRVLLLVLTLLALLTLTGTAGHHLHVLHHLHQGGEHFAGLIAVARAREIFDRLEQILQIALRHRPRARRHLTGLLVLTLRVLRKLLHVARHRLAQLVHQRADFFVRRTALERIVQLILDAAQLFGRIGEIAFLERKREVPHQALRALGARIVSLVVETMVERAHREIGAEIGLVELLGAEAERIDRGLDANALVVIAHREVLALLDQSLRQRLGEHAVR
jgi:hypothetical protein